MNARKAVPSTTTVKCRRPAAARTRTTSRAVPASKNADAATHPMDGKQRRELIAVAAYFRAERRGFAPSAEWDDWFQAEIEIDTQLQEAAGRLPRSHATASHT